MYAMVRNVAVAPASSVVKVAPLSCRRRNMQHHQSASDIFFAAMIYNSVGNNMQVTHLEFEVSADATATDSIVYSSSNDAHI